MQYHGKLSGVSKIPSALIFDKKSVEIEYICRIYIHLYNKIYNNIYKYIKIYIKIYIIYIYILIYVIYIYIKSKKKNTVAIGPF